MPNTETAAWIFYIEEEDIYVCNNCGAHATSPGDIQHFDNCSPGESERWKKMYSEAAEEEATWLENHYNTILD